MRNGRRLRTIGVLALLAGIGLASGANAQSIMVTSPNGGETWATGTAQTITWTSTAVTGNARIYLYGNWTKVRVLGKVLASAGTWTWNIPADEPARTNARIRVQSLTDTAVSDYGDGLFTIGSPALTVTSPNGGESLGRGLRHTISWNNTGVTGNVTIYLYNSWTKLRVLGTPAASAGSWLWTIPADEPIASTYRIRVQSNENTAITDYGNALFSIVDATLTLTSPNGGESWTRGGSYPVTWSACGVTGNVRIWLYDNWTKIGSLGDAPADAGTWTWAIPSGQMPGSTYRIRVQSLSTAANDYGDGLFTIEEGGEETILLPGDVPLTMVWIPGGSFWMGRYSGERSGDSDEDPQHQVTLSGFWMGKYEVTQAQWLALMGSWPGTAPSSSCGVGDAYPAYYISWSDAQNFITALKNYTGQTFRLPSEAEWEYACRADTQTRFYFGDSLDVGDSYEDDGVRSQYMWYCGNDRPYGSKPVGGRLPNAFGLYDMSGNLWEWCQDWHHSSYTGAPSDGSAWEVPSDSGRVLRGGYWGSNARYCRSAIRNYYGPSSRDFNFGFRLAR